MAHPHLVVSLEAIFLSTFVMIGQNRADPEAPGVGKGRSGSPSSSKSSRTSDAGSLEAVLELTDEIHRFTLRTLLDLADSGGGPA